MAEIIREWVGYNGQTTEERKPDGSTKKTKHNKVWAAALTKTGHIYVRYGPAKHPLKLTEQIIRPKRGIPESEALVEANRIFQEKVAEKLHQKGYEAIPFDTPPHSVPSFSKWRMSDEPEEMVAPDNAPAVEEKVLSFEVSLQDLEVSLRDLGEWLLVEPCPHCRTIHPRFLMDIGDGHIYEAETLIRRLGQTEEGRAWLAVPCVYQDGKLLHAGTREVLVTVVELGLTDSL
jgi:hypothetical protein